MTADIAKMYRQVWVNAEDRSLQRILWRMIPDQPITTYELNTITYGTTSAPFLATRCLQQLNEDEAVNYPEAGQMARNGFYVGDLITGTDDVDTALSLQQELIEMLKKSGLTLRKWASNHPALLQHLSPEDVERKVLLSFGNEDVIKALGLLWNSTTDKLMFCLHIKQDKVLTKRSVLRSIASIYEPLGLLSPFIIQCKIFMQQLWQLKVNWDDPLNTEVKEHWQEKTDLIEKGRVSKKSSSLSLNPFLDGNQLIRVDGRLQHSELAFDQKHPLILPKEHYIISLIIEDTHKKNLHASGQLLFSVIRQEFWIPDAKNVLKKTIKKCLICCKIKAATATQLMGQLPQVRVKPSKRFTNSGVDYSGPFYIKQGGIRSKTLVKCYIVLFICLATKTIHVELVTDLSTEAYCFSTMFYC